MMMLLVVVVLILVLVLMVVLMMVLMMILIDIDDEDLEDLRMRMTMMSIPSGILGIYTVVPLIQDLPSCYKIFFGDSVDGSHEDTPSESPLPSGVNLRGQMSTYETLPMVFETCLRFIFFGLKMGLLTKKSSNEYFCEGNFFCFGVQWRFKNSNCWMMTS